MDYLLEANEDGEHFFNPNVSSKINKEFEINVPPTGEHRKMSKKDL
jgi:hypothetical protein